MRREPEAASTNSFGPLNLILDHGPLVRHKDTQDFACSCYKQFYITLKKRVRFVSVPAKHIDP